MKFWRNRVWWLCALVLASAIAASAQGITDAEGVRPSGTAPGAVRQAKPVTAKHDDDADVSPSPRRKKTQEAKTGHTRTHRARKKAKEEEEESASAPTEYTPNGIPKTTAASIIVVDANTGQT